MLKKHYLHIPGNIQVEFSIEAEPLNQIAIVVKEGVPNKYSVHDVKLHPSVDFPDEVMPFSRSQYLPTLVHMPIIMDRLYKICEVEDLELVEFVYNLTPDKVNRIKNS